jgi:hypothetical protein
MKKIKLQQGDFSFGEGWDVPKAKSKPAAPSNAVQRLVKSRLDKKALQPVIERLQGGATLRSQSNALGYSGDNELRAALRALLGQDGYKALVKQRAPGGGIAPAVRVHAQDKKLPVLNGAKLKWRHSDAILIFAKQRCHAIKEQAKGIASNTPLAHALAREFKEMKAMLAEPRENAWHYKQVPRHEPKIRNVALKDGNEKVLDTGQPVTLFISPKGRTYVKASPLEHAHLIIKYPEGTTIRLARWEQSSQYRTSQRAIKLHEQALTHHRRKEDAEASE